MVDVFRETFCWLPLGFVLNNRVLVVHGGCALRPGGRGLGCTPARAFALSCSSACEFEVGRSLTLHNTLPPATHAARPSARCGAWTTFVL